jgi:hypothetical protein
MKKSALVLISGIGWILFYTGSFTALGSGYPTVESSGAEIVSWFTDNGTNAQIYAWTAAFAFLSLVSFGALVAELLPKPNRYIFFSGILAFAITAMVQAWFWAGMALHPEGLAPETAQVLFDITQYWGPIINGATMAMAIPVAVLGFGASKSVPSWLGWLSVALFVEQAIETITVFGSSGFLAPGGTMNLYLGGLFGMAWVIGMIVWGFRENRSTERLAA